MAHRDGLSQWEATVSTHLPHLSRPQAAALAAWSYGIVLAQCCGLATVAAVVAGLRGVRENTGRARLRDWYRAAAEKRGAKRRDVAVEACFAPLLRWVLAWWPPEERRLALALDASSLGDRLVVLAVSVVYRGCAVPVAWAVLPAGRKGAWRPHWARLLDALAGAVPPGWAVLVLADRGRYARWLFQAIVRQGGHPLLRINAGGRVRPAGAGGFAPLRALAPAPGAAWAGRATCFATRDCRLDCTLLARWEEGYADPWLVLTGLAPERAEAAWYGPRGWVEQGFKDLKRGGWQWQRTRMADPDRMARLWLALAVATLWVVSVGGEAEATLPASGFDALPEAHSARRRGRHRPPARLLGCFRRGLLAILVALVQGQPLPPGRFRPEPWPAPPSIARPATALVGLT